jgi:hypothetical protein
MRWTVHSEKTLDGMLRAAGRRVPGIVRMLSRDRAVTHHLAVSLVIITEKLGCAHVTEAMTRARPAVDRNLHRASRYFPITRSRDSRPIVPRGHLTRGVLPSAIR